MAAISDVPAADRKRFATCYQFAVDKQAVEWAAAAEAYDPKVQLASFKTVTSRSMKALENNTEESIKEGDLNRLALCYIHSTDKQSVDWPAAAKAYDSKVKIESFRTVVQRALRKHGYVDAKAKKTATPRKRKAKTAMDDAEAENEAATGKKPRKMLKTLVKAKEAAEQTGEDDSQDDD